MTDVRFSVPGVPPEAAKGITAFAPHFNRQAASGAQSYKYAVSGFPGTRGIPMQARENTQISPDYGDLAQAGTSRSSDAPDAFYPNQYYQRYIAEYAGGPDVTTTAVYSPQFPGLTTLLPIPAEDGRAAYLAGSAALAQAAILNRKREVPVFPRNYRPGSGTWNG
jgi:hypothetical protein